MTQSGHGVGRPQDSIGRGAGTLTDCHTRIPRLQFLFLSEHKYTAPPMRMRAATPPSTPPATAPTAGPSVPRKGAIGAGAGSKGGAKLRGGGDGGGPGTGGGRGGGGGLCGPSDGAVGGYDGGGGDGDGDGGGGGGGGGDGEGDGSGCVVPPPSLQLGMLRLVLEDASPAKLMSLVN